MILVQTLVALASVPAAAAAQTDPRPAIVELSLAGRPRPALLRAESALASEPGRARALGIDLLRADLLARLGRERDATEAYAQALTSPSGLGPWARLRLAVLQERLGHPEVAAGLVTNLLAEGAPDGLLRPALALFAQSIERGGDCRLLGGVAAGRITGDLRRKWDLVRADCLLRLGSAVEASRLLRTLLEADSRDALALDIAARLEARVAAPDPALARRLGMAAFHHREFDKALRLLPDTPLALRLDAERADIAYARARALYWTGKYDEAAAAFDDLARRTPTATQRADSLCQAGRSLELTGRVAEALSRFRRAWEADPGGDWAPSALLGALRIEVALGEGEAARGSLARLARTPGAAGATARGALFLAVSDLQRGLFARVAETLSVAERSGEVAAEELAYWRGRLAEAVGDDEGAVERYVEVLRRRPFHPLAEAARRRLAAPGLASMARKVGLAAAGVGDPGNLQKAALLLGDTDAIGRQARLRALARLRDRRDSAAWLDWTPVPVAEWPLWSAAPTRPEDLLAGLGLFSDAGDAAIRHFPASDLRLAFSGAAALATDELATRRSLARAEALFERRPRSVPFEWVDPKLLRLLYPFPWAPLIRAQASAFRSDPTLLAAILREESRFDPAALSPAGARGLAQFTLQTAQRLARQTRLTDQVSARDLHDPALAIPLGAAYLAELGRRFPRAPAVAIAAYNAGEDQAALWRRHCVTSEPEEYLAKIGYGETKAYVIRVLESQAIYQALYGGG